MTVNIASFSMAEYWLILSHRLLVFLLLQFSTRVDCLESPQQTVHVSIFGGDDRTCGTSLEPCRTIAMAVDQVDWGGRIVLNGNGTKQQPFDCGNTITNSHHSGIPVSKSVTMTSLESTLAYVSCLKGIHFHRSNERLSLSITRWNANRCCEPQRPYLWGLSNYFSNSFIDFYNCEVVS